MKGSGSSPGVACWATYLVGGLLVHDAMLAPIVVAASVALIYVLIGLDEPN